MKSEFGTSTTELRKTTFEALDTLLYRDPGVHRGIVPPREDAAFRGIFYGAEATSDWRKHSLLLESNRHVQGIMPDVTSGLSQVGIEWTTCWEGQASLEPGTQAGRLNNHRIEQHYALESHYMLDPRAVQKTIDERGWPQAEREIARACDMAPPPDIDARRPTEIEALILRDAQIIKRINDDISRFTRTNIPGLTHLAERMLRDTDALVTMIPDCTLDGALETVEHAGFDSADHAAPEDICSAAAIALATLCVGESVLDEDDRTGEFELFSDVGCLNIAHWKNVRNATLETSASYVIAIAHKHDAFVLSDSADSGFRNLAKRFLGVMGSRGLLDHATNAEDLTVWRQLCTAATSWAQEYIEVDAKIQDYWFDGDKDAPVSPWRGVLRDLHLIRAAQSKAQIRFGAIDAHVEIVCDARPLHLSPASPSDAHAAGAATAMKVRAGKLRLNWALTPARPSMVDLNKLLQSCDNADPQAKALELCNALAASGHKKQKCRLAWSAAQFLGDALDSIKHVPTADQLDVINGLIAIGLASKPKQVRGIARLLPTMDLSRVETPVLEDLYKECLDGVRPPIDQSNVQTAQSVVATALARAKISREGDFLDEDSTPRDYVPTL